MITVQNLTFAYEGSYQNIFENASFQLDSTWKLGFIGRNGRGKTTFLNLLMGKYPYQGHIAANVNFAYFPYHVPDQTQLAQHIAQQISPNHQDWQLEKELSLLDVSLDILHRPFNTLSNGEQTKLLLATLFLGENNFLLIDEPTNHLDTHGRKVLGRYLRSKDSYILVSHDRTLLDTAIDHVLSINRANIEVQRGNFTTWHENKQRQDAYELAENDRLKKDIKRLNKAAKQSREWADKVESTKIGLKAGEEKSVDRRAFIGEKSRRMQQRRKNLEGRQNTAMEEKSKLLKNIETADNLKITQLTHHKTTVIAAQDLTIAYGTKAVCQNINFAITQGDRVALAGKNGSGKSSILKLIMGEDIPHTGALTTASGLKISYVPQDTAFLSGNLTQFAQAHQIDESLFKAILRKLGFSRQQFEKDMADFSHGQKKKTLIAKSLCEKAHIQIWDEPLNFIDLLSRLQIEELILKHQPTLLFVEHDAVFCKQVATKVISL